MFERIIKLFKRGKKKDGKKRKRPADIVSKQGFPVPEEFKNDRKKGIEFIMKLAVLARKTGYTDEKFNNAVKAQVIYEELQFEIETGLRPCIYFNPGYIQLRFDLDKKEEVGEAAEKLREKGIISKEGLEVVLTKDDGKKVYAAGSSGPEPFELGVNDAGEKVRQLKQYSAVKKAEK